MKLTVILILAAFGFAFPAFSQDDKATVTDEELMKYAEVMDSINEMTASVRIMLSDMVKENDSISAARYNELSKIAADDAKLAEAKATPEEIAFVKEVAAKKSEETAKINEAYQKLAKDYVTVPVFNKVKKALANDASLKTRYESLMAELGKDDPSGA